MLWLLLFACAGSEPDPAAIAALPDPVPALLAADELTRVAALRAIAESDPGRLAALCPRLEAGPARDACRRLEGRPHLRVAPAPVRAGPRAAPGPASSALVPDPSLRSPLLAQSPERGDCPDDAPPCLTDAALRLPPEEAARRCLAIGPEVGQKECFFRAAEERAEDPKNAAAVADLCLAAADFAPRCLGHSTNRLARASALRFGQSGDPDALIAGARALAEPWQTSDLRDDLLGRYWSAAMELVFAWMPTPGGAGLAGLPPEARPHLRAALAQRLVRDSVGGVGLAERVRSALAALAAPTPPAPWPGAPPAPAAKVALWTRDESKADGAIPAAHLRETSRRAVAEDEAADLAICVLEAAAREPGGDAEALLREGLAHPDPLVRWTAERLSRARGPR